MAYEIVFAPQAVDDIRHLNAADRSRIVAAIQTHLRHEPQKESKSRIKRLRGLRQPEFRLRADDFRIYYDVAARNVFILSIIAKHRSYDWLAQHGIPL